MRIRALTVGPMSVCCYIVSCEETSKAIIIDPGGNETDILALCDEDKVTVESIVFTHGHPDHVCGCARIKEATGAATVMHIDDAAFFAKPEVGDYFTQFGMGTTPTVDKTVQDGDLISFGNESLKVLHTPGHTPGGICLYAAPNLFTGDTLFVGGVGRTDFPGGDTNIMLRSIQDRLLILPADTVVWPGHGYGGSTSTIGEEQRSNPFLRGAL
jgi:hydroxyacylglutathione hydrolase